WKGSDMTKKRRYSLIVGGSKSYCCDLRNSKYWIPPSRLTASYSNSDSGTYFLPLKARAWAFKALPGILGTRIREPFITTRNPKGSEGSVARTIRAMAMELSLFGKAG